MNGYVITEDELTEAIRLFRLYGICPTAINVLESNVRSRPFKDEIKKLRNDIVNQISESMKSCAYYDDMISGEGGCIGNRNGVSVCKDCRYFEIDTYQLKNTIESIEESLK